jgi:hypothetical protein
MATGADNLDKGILLKVEGFATATVCVSVHRALGDNKRVLTSPRGCLQHPAGENIGGHGCFAGETGTDSSISINSDVKLP